MARRLRIGIAQMNCTVGDLAGNATMIRSSLMRARKRKIDILSFPELAITGYPPEDLLLKKRFVEDNRRALHRIARSAGPVTAVIGFVDRDRNGRLYNAAAVIQRGRVAGVYRKMRLPNYGVFDEKRYFSEGEALPLFEVKGIAFGVAICEDIWQGDALLAAQAAAGARLVITINSSPFHSGKTREREELIRRAARRHRIALSYANLVGGQDELVFDGQSIIVDAEGKIAARGAPFSEDLVIADLPGTGVQPRALPLEPVAEVYAALRLGVGDYTRKNGFREAVIAVSGGVDSALVAAIAVDALGRQNVTGVFMPSRYTSARSERDARDLARALGIRLISMPIDPLYGLSIKTIDACAGEAARGIAEENLQARLRGTLLMTLSNRYGWLVLTTGNKSEMSTGYATLYGDMAGGFAVIKDVPKTLVYKLAAYRNRLGRAIPASTIRREPTAELTPGQRDADTLPPYGTLDRILKAYVEEDETLPEIVRRGFDRKVARRVIGMVDRSEYKRRQAPPGIKITPKSFGRDRRMPITNKYT